MKPVQSVVSLYLYSDKQKSTSLFDGFKFFHSHSYINAIKFLSKENHF